MSPKDLEALLGKEVGVSRWFLMDQDRIGLFADVTEDQQFIHVDPEKAKATPFGGAIAHGFLTLSLLSAMAEEAVPLIKGLTHSINYGFDRVRFISPVAAGKRVRGRFELIAITVGATEVSQTLKVTIEIEGNEKPALVAEWITRHYFS
ncbi:MAG: Nodulation protein N [Rhodobacteraceae bacterium]|nr:MAG: Nodulation protein N [Paracoccaceae bacterium]